MPLAEALQLRRSSRELAGEPLSAAELSQLLWSAQGRTAPWGGRTAPSAGALYPLELHLVTAEGAWRYVPRDHALEAASERDLRPELGRAALGQAAPADAAAVLVVTAVHARARGKYGARAERYAALEAGHVAQNILLAAAALGLAAVPVGAFDDERVAAVLDLPDGESPLYLLAVGRPGG